MLNVTISSIVEFFLKRNPSLFPSKYIAKHSSRTMNIAERVKERRTQSNTDSLVFTDNKKSKGNLTSRFLRCRNETDDSDSEENFEESLRRFPPVIDDIESGSDEIPAVYVLVPSRPRTNYVRSKSLSPKRPRTYSVQSQSSSPKLSRAKSVRSLPSSSNLQGKLLSTSNSLDEPGVYERYFEENANPSSTSGNTLSDPNMLNKVEYFDVMSNIPVKHKREIESLHQRHKYQFHRWYISLMTGYNLCFYGYGSKKRLLEEFFEIHFKDQPLLVINGFEPNLKFKDALKIVLDGIVKPKLGSRRGTFEKHADLIRRYFLNPNRRTERLYIMIHNLDGPCLRNTQILDTLGLLASTHNIFVVASVDNVNAPLLFDRDRDAKFKFIWNDATTFRPYEEESIYEDLKVKKRRIGLTMSVVISILSSWIVNRRMMFKTLAAYQISRYQCGANKPEDAGMEHGLLYNKLREEFWVDGDSKFRMFLNDFHNHDVIKTRTSEFGCNIYYIPLEADVLKKVLNNKNLFE